MLSAALSATAHAVLITDRNGVIQWVNPAFTRLTGYSAEEAVGRTPRILNSGRQSPAFYRQLWKTITAGRVWRGEMVNRRSDGSLYIEEQTITPVRDATGEITHFISIKQDVTHRRRQQEQIERLVLSDPLTGLANRRGLREYLRRLAGRPRQGQALVVIDVDYFKIVNDTVGYAAGDRLLLAIARTVKQNLRASDFLARLEEDTFALVLSRRSLEKARAAVEQIRLAVDELQYHTGPHTFDPTISAGMASLTADTDPERVLVRAEAALHQAKESGKNRVVCYAPDPRGSDPVAESRRALSIRDALAQGRLALHFQPVIRLDTGAVVHFEALIRMQDEHGQFLSPSAFLTTAERFGLMPRVDRWVVEQAVRVLRSSPELGIFVNLSGSSLRDEKLLLFVRDLVGRSGLRPGQLGFEITESAAVQDLPLGRRWIHEMKSLGCSFALDDFGVGFTSFHYLRELPSDFVKIDGLFVRNLESDPVNRALVQAMTTVAHALGKQVIAEWVETDCTAEALRQLGVEAGQGFLWGQPGPHVLRE